jgi:hypothetical protein
MTTYEPIPTPEEATSQTRKAGRNWFCCTISAIATLGLIVLILHPHSLISKFDPLKTSRIGDISQTNAAMHQGKKSIG